MTVRLPLLFVLLVLLVSGCTESPSVTRLPSSAPSAGPVQPTVETTADLAALKKRAGIADCPASEANPTPVTNGLPATVLPCLGGGREVNLAGLRGRPMMINVWAQWCPPCREEAPFISDVAKQAGDRLMVIGVDFHDPYPDLAIEYAEAAGWRFPQLQDADTGLAPLQITAPPVTLFVRADGTIAARHAGAFTSTAQITQLLDADLGVQL